MADTKQQWYKDAKYGLFIHWGLYSILAGEWKDPKTGEVTKTDRIAEWIENNLNIDKEDYRKLKDEFHPDKFDADMFVKRAKEQWGVKYIVLTSKHHEGFAMYDSKVSDFNVVKAAGRDILRELSDACKKYDMTMGIYYSQAQDWDDDNAYKKDYEDKNEWKPEFRTYFDEKCKPQLKELLENYDNISLIWFDTPMGMTADEAQELRDWVNGSGSLYTDPDQQHCNSIKCKEQPVLPDPDLCCVWYVPGDIPLYRIHGWNLQEPG